MLFVNYINRSNLTNNIPLINKKHGILIILILIFQSSTLLGSNIINQIDDTQNNLEESQNIEENNLYKNWIVPTIHTGSVLLITRAIMYFIWPSSFDVTDVNQNSNNFIKTWSRLPEFDNEKDVFEWDGDSWTINFVAHGLMGSEFYLRYRQCLDSIPIAIGMSFAWSFTWEYLIEGWNKQPSLIDLIWTPVGGFLIGELRYQLYRVSNNINSSVGRHIVLYLVDPLGQLERDLFSLNY